MSDQRLPVEVLEPALMIVRRPGAGPHTPIVLPVLDEPA